MTKFLRLARLVEIIHIVSSDPTWSARRLAEYFEISEKRIFDDLAELNAANIPIVYDGELKGYTFLKKPKIPTEMILEGLKSR